MARIQKKIRQERLQDILRASPFLTDEGLASNLQISVQTIRLDRLELEAAELRERIKQMAEATPNQTNCHCQQDIIGELIDLDIGKK